MDSRKPHQPQHQAPLKEQHYLTPLFEPRSVAIIGASEREGSVGRILVRNMIEAGFLDAHQNAKATLPNRQLFAVNPNHRHIFDLPTFKKIGDIPQRVDLAVIATKASTVLDIIEDCGRAGVRAAVVISAGFSETGAEGAELERALQSAARRHNIRLIGPNCLGIIRPEIGLNATFAQGNALPGSIGLVSQSGALCGAILDWARPNNVGFSSVISIGSSTDVDFGEILDFLVTDPKTENIFLYIENIVNARSFMSALRAAARVKPVLLIKANRHSGEVKVEIELETESNSNSDFARTIISADEVFDAVVRRAGAVRLDTLRQLLAAARALFSHFRPRGNRLAIIANGGGPGLLAADHAVGCGIPLASLSAETITALNAALPITWSHNNPINILGDARTEHYRVALNACLADDQVDGVLVILAPQAITDPLEAARAVIDIAQKSETQIFSPNLSLSSSSQTHSSRSNWNKPIVTCWLGKEQVLTSRTLFDDAGLPNFITPEPAVDLFSQISAYYRNQQLLMQTPPSIAHSLQPDIDTAIQIIESALHKFGNKDGIQGGKKDGNKNPNKNPTVLNEMESKALLTAFHIPTTQSVVARSLPEALSIAEQLGLPVVMKIASPDIIHKTDSGGVRLNLLNLQAVTAAWHDIQDRVRKNRPDAEIEGVTIEPMVMKPNGRELMIGVAYDKTFGPTIIFGAGGAAVEVHQDRAVALPPLNNYLAADMIRSTRVARLLGKFRHMPPVDLDAIETVLLRVSEMVCELPWIQSMNINPLIADEHGVIAVDARIVVENLPVGLPRYGHMAIHPYPSNLVTQCRLKDGVNITIRPLRPEDAELEQEFVRHLSEESKYFRFMNTIRELTPSMLARLTQLDYDRDMAFVAITEENGRLVELGVCRYASNPDGESCEFALVIADAWQRRGIARRLMNALIENARTKGLKYMVGQILHNNDRMLKFVDSLGFVVSTSLDDPNILKAVLELQ